MANQHDLDISNATHASVRADFNAALVALGRKQNGPTAPPFTGGFGDWADTSTNVMKRRNAAGTGWIARDTLNETFVITRSSNTALNAADRTRVISAVAGYTQTFDAASTLGDGWFCFFRNDSADSVILDPNGAETIDGSATLTLDPGYGVLIFCNGTNFTVATALVSPGKAKRLRMLEDYWVAGDGTNFSPAMNRWLATGGRHLCLSGEADYDFDSTVVIDRAIGTTIEVLGNKMVGLNLRGANDILFDVGNATVQRFHFWLKGAVITKQNTSSAGAAIRLRNIWYWGVKDVRAYCNNNYYRFIDGYACGYGECDDLLIQDTRKEWCWIRGGGASAGVPDGIAVANKFERCVLDGNHSATSTGLEDQGGMLFGIYSAANWIVKTEAYRHKGYAFYFAGDATSKLSNALNLVQEPNVEATNGSSGILRTDYTVDGQIGGGGAWGEGNDIPAVRLGPNTNQWRVNALKIGGKNGAFVGVLDEGTENEIDISAQGYNTDASLGGEALKLASTALRTKVKSVHALFLNRVINNLGGVNQGYDFEQVSFHSINSTTPIVGLSVGNNYRFGRIIEQGPSAFVAVATKIKVPWGAEFILLTGTGTIDEIEPGYFGQRVTISMADAGQTLRDITTTAKNIVLKTSATSFTSATGRESIQLVYRGDAWLEMGRVS